MNNEIVIKGANENNLKSLDVRIPRDKLVVLTGLSGSGKSSLAFDTIYAEGQRRYMESLSSYARQFLGQMEKPNVEYIEGLSPAISIDQKTTNRNPRSTVGTVTEIHDYLRLLYARIGKPHCPKCGLPISSQSIDQMVDFIMGIGDGAKIQILAPLARAKKGTHEKLIERVRKEGFTRVRVDGEIKVVGEDEIKLEKTYKHSIEIVIDRIVVKPGAESRISEACELAVSESEGGLCQVIGEFMDQKIDKLFSTKLACPEHGASLEELEPRMFSFNAPFGACPDCSGIGFTQKLEPSRLLDMNESIDNDVLKPIYGTMEFAAWYRAIVRGLADYHKVDTSIPLKDMPEKFRNELFWGTGDRDLYWEYKTKTKGEIHRQSKPFEGLLTNLERRVRETNSDYFRNKMEPYLVTCECPVCKGKRFKPEILAVTVGDKNISDLSDLSIIEALRFFETLALTEKEKIIGAQIIKEIKARLNFLKDVGLEYLTLSRAAGTLSGGESQRIRLATQIGSSLVGVLYILDEPSIGLHQKDNDMLLKTLRNLTDMGNTLIVVEHDEDTMYAADHIVDIGPGAGINGGKLVCQGTVDDIKACKESITGQYLSGEKKIEVPEKRREGNGKYLKVINARQNNLKGIDVEFPLGKLVCVTGVSGSGKSSLVNEILYKGVSKITNRTQDEPGLHDEITGLENIDKVIDIDQTPIGKTPRSNPATYTGMFDIIRDLFATLPEAKMRGYQKGRFSFNVKGGRCEACSGDGIIKIEMHFLPDVYVPCEVCHGRRYNRETLEVKYKGKSIFDVLDMSVAEAVEFFKNVPQIHKYLVTLNEVGLGYIKLGQPSTELSGGEAQRVKLATELAKRSTGKTLYILDEPTTGLHFADVDKLISVLDRLVDQGNTVVVIEHNLDVIKRADYIIDLGPDGGNRGGTIVTTGTPEEVSRCEKSYTGKYLKRILNK
ncbi:MAG: excinuclease ABC subunit UvrA [Clostridia bacterium]|nr:excinuclease ABC subunit UvrA [Clostridia bacterium]